MQATREQSCRVVICDDQHAFRQVIGVVLGLEPDIEVVGEASDGLGVIDVVAQVKPDVLVLDLAMPGLDGLEALPLVLAASPGTRVLVLTGFGSSQVRQRALAAGAASFVEKGTDVAGIVSEIRRLCPSA